MRSWLVIGVVVFAVTFVTNLVVQAVWPGNEVDWAASAIVGATTAVVLTLVLRRTDLDR